MEPRPAGEEQESEEEASLRLARELLAQDKRALEERARQHERDSQIARSLADDSDALGTSAGAHALARISVDASSGEEPASSGEDDDDVRILSDSRDGGAQHSPRADEAGPSDRHLGDAPPNRDADPQAPDDATARLLKNLELEERNAAEAAAEREAADRALIAALLEQDKQQQQDALAEQERQRVAGEAKAREVRAADEARAKELVTREAQDAEHTRALNAMAERTKQDVSVLSAAAVHDYSTNEELECGICFCDVPKAEAECVGNFNRYFCNHWFSREALVMYIMKEVEQQRFAFACPTCKADKCKQCERHNVCGVSGARFCCIPQAQMRSILTPEQLNTVLVAEERFYRMSNKDMIVECPHPACSFWYALAPDDTAGPEIGAQARGSGDGAACKWKAGRDLWCTKCNVQYCLYCGEQAGTLVRWHSGKSCQQYLAQVAESKADGERKAKAAEADVEYQKMRGLTWQRCPKCQNDAWKPDSHCNRMICKCGANFCFLCAENITKMRYGHYDSPDHPACKYKTWHISSAPATGPTRCRCSACRR